MYQGDYFNVIPLDVFPTSPRVADDDASDDVVVADVFTRCCWRRHQLDRMDSTDLNNDAEAQRVSRALKSDALRTCPPVLFECREILLG
jgi:hypothetical protein